MSPRRTECRADEPPCLFFWHSDGPVRLTLNFAGSEAQLRQQPEIAMQPTMFKRHRFPPDIRHAVWLNFR
jgi:hypothetical protein